MTTTPPDNAHQRTAGTLYAISIALAVFGIATGRFFGLAAGLLIFLLAANRWPINRAGELFWAPKATAAKQTEKKESTRDNSTYSFTYNGEANASYVYVQGRNTTAGRVERSVDAGHGIVVDLDDEGKVVGVEVLHSANDGDKGGSEPAPTSPSEESVREIAEKP